MKVVEVKTLQEAVNLMPTLGVIQIALMMRDGHVIEVEDERKGVKYVFKPKEISA